ncbi:hypothetical protein [Bowdeniella massiliensis]|uniref:VG15 protein n=1 Tax=Bowdeniella massiliensis TaxID=2932264 RepID=UPI002027FA47|nr:hypothetical protein [Bowdeniella massiliensis]
MALADELIAEYTKGTDTLADLADKEITAFFAQLDLTNPAACREGIQRAMYYWVSNYGKVAAELAAQFYEAAGGNPADLATVINPQQLRRATNYATRHLYSEDPKKALASVTQLADKSIRQFGRDTIARNSVRDRVRWARVPSLSTGKACAFCIMLASRGSIYATQDKALQAQDGTRYHGGCRCRAIPIGLFQAYPEGYDPDFMYEEIYLKARKTLSGKEASDPKKILAVMRQQSSEFVEEGHHDDLESAA